MAAESDKIMFEVYRETGFNRRYHVIYYTELDEGARDRAIEAALSGEHFYDGFIAVSQSSEAKNAIAVFLRRLNDGVTGTADELEAVLARFLTT
jgi:hypothetical protein